MSVFKNHRHVPICYLQGFSNPNKQVDCFNKSTGVWSKATIANALISDCVLEINSAHVLLNHEDVEERFKDDLIDILDNCFDRDCYNPDVESAADVMGEWWDGFKEFMVAQTIGLHELENTLGLLENEWHDLYSKLDPQELDLNKELRLRLIKWLWIQNRRTLVELNRPIQIPDDDPEYMSVSTPAEVRYFGLRALMNIIREPLDHCIEDSLSGCFFNLVGGNFLTSDHPAMSFKKINLDWVLQDTIVGADMLLFPVDPKRCLVLCSQREVGGFLGVEDDEICDELNRLITEHAHQYVVRYPEE